MAFRKAYDLDTPEARKRLVESFQADIRSAKKHFAKDFKRMCEDMDICRNGAPKAWTTSKKYRVNITQRYVRQKVSTLYARNPRAVAKRRERMEYRFWDGTDQQLMEMAQLAMAGDPLGLMYMQDVIEGQNRKMAMEKVGRTLELLCHYFIDEQVPSFKTQMKRCVRSSVQTAVGYVKLGFQREMELSPDAKAKISDDTKRLRHIEALMAELEDPESELDPQMSKEAEELRQSIAAIQSKPEIVVREGLVFDFPASTSIIPDPGCTNLSGWIDANWLVEEIYLTPQDVKEYFNLDLGTVDYKAYKTDSAEYRRNPNTEITGKKNDVACCWIMQHKPSGMVYTMIDGFDDFCVEPQAPDVDLERFFNIYALTFNEMEHAEELFPLSDVRTMLPQQMEMNRSREAVRQHRKANRPGYVIPQGILSDEDKGLLANHDDNAVIELAGIDPGRKIEDYLQEIPKQGVDPNLYETNSVMGDVFMSMGAQEATFGGTSNATATESAIAESNRTGALEAEVDELDDFLSALFRDAGSVLLAEMDQMSVAEIVGPGAAWPTLSRGEIMRELYLDVQAGSNGRPNKAQKQSALQQLLPILMQVPGVSPGWIAKQLIEAMDESIDLEEALADGLPSIQMINQQAQMGTGDPASDPNQQGSQGSQNAEKAPGQGGTAAPMGGNNMSPMAPGAGQQVSLAL